MQRLAAFITCTSCDTASEGLYQIAACMAALLRLSRRTTPTVCRHQRALSIRTSPTLKQDEPCFFVFFYLWLRGGGRRRGRFTRQRSLLLKRMQAGLCLMIHCPAMQRKRKWVLRICSTLLKQTRRTVIDENDARQPACARGVLAHAKERPSLIKHARLQYNAAGFFFVKMNIKMRNTDTRPPSQNKAIFGVYSLPVFKVQTKAAKKHIYSSLLANFLVNVQLYDEFSHIFWSFDVHRFHTEDCRSDFPSRWLKKRARGPRTYLKDLHSIFMHVLQEIEL